MGRKTILLIVVAFFLTSGCVQSSTTAFDGVDIDFEGSFDVSDGRLSMEGTIANTGQETGRFENVTVYFLTRDKTVIKSVEVGTLVDEPVPVDTQVDQVPEEIVIYSEDFSKADEISLAYYDKTGGERNKEYSIKVVTGNGESITDFGIESTPTD